MVKRKESGSVLERAGARSHTRSSKPPVMGRQTVAALGRELDEQDIAALAYELWQARGCPIGSPDEDWFRAEEELQARR